MAKAIIGLDIGSSSVKVINLRKSKRGYELLNFGIAPLPPQTIVDSSLMNSGAVVEATGQGDLPALPMRGRDYAP